MKKADNIWIEHFFPANRQEDYPEGSMYNIMAAAAARIPDKTAIVFEGNEISFGELLRGIKRAVAAMRASGVKKNDIITIISPNIPQAVCAFYAANYIGATANMLHPLLSVNELCDSIENTDSRLILMLDRVYPKIMKHEWKKGFRPKIVFFRICDALKGFPRLYMRLTDKTAKFSGEGLFYWNAWLNSGNGQDIGEADNESDSVAAIMCSGGTTGTPKGVMLTNFNFNALYSQIFDMAGFPYELGMDIQALAVMPIFHSYGLGICVHSMLAYGVKVYLLPTFDLDKSVKLIFNKRIERIFAVPALVEAIARSEQIEKEDLSFLKTFISGGDALPAELQNRINAYLEKGGCTTRVCEAYGQTEITSGGIINPDFAAKTGSVGIPFPDTECMLVYPGTTEAVPEGEQGELCVCAPTVMKGYFKNPEQTGKALMLHEDGRIWLHTGDLMRRDGDGYYIYCQRLSRMIISSGYNVYLTMIEKTLRDVPFVADCAALPVDDRAVGKRFDLYVQPAPAESGEVDRKLRNVCAENFPEYSQPRRILIVEKIPKTVVGKTDFAALRGESDEG